MQNFENTPWFETLSEVSTEKTYKSGEVVAVQGEYVASVGIVISGKASVLAYSINGDETWVGGFSEGQFFGAISLFSEDISRFEIRAVSKLVVRVLSQAKMLELVRADPNLCEALARDVSLRLDSTLSDLLNVHTLSVKGRICAELLRMAIPIGIDPERKIIRPSPVFVALGRRLNSTRESVSRTVSELQNKGILSREPGALIIENSERLRDAIELI